MFLFKRLKNLYVVKVGFAKNFKKYTPENEFVIAKNISYECYKDIFTGTKYDNLSSFAASPCCSNPIPLTSFITTLENYDKIISTGFISEKDCMKILKEINTNKKINNENLKKTEKKVNEDEINFKKLFIPKSPKTSTQKKEDIDCANIITNKEFETEPAIRRTKELKNLIISLASSKKSPLLVGESGVGKTAIVFELAYLIQRGEVPEFLKDKEIIEINMSSLISGTRYVGTLEEKLEKILKDVKDRDAILFIDEIHTIIGAGASSNSDSDVADILKVTLNRDDIKIIGTTTTEDYDKYFSLNSIKNRFEFIEVKEPNERDLRNIIIKTIADLSDKNNIGLDNLSQNIYSIIDILAACTSKHCRNFLDKQNNPDLVIGILDKAFADAIVNNQDELTIENIIYGISSARIYGEVKSRTINKIKSMNPVIKKESNVIDFCKIKKA